MTIASVLCGTLLVSTLLAAAPNVHDFTLNSIDGQPTPLAQFNGKVILIVNVASRCGYTPQYAGLEALYRKYKDKGLVILGFPANNFLWQEPGSNQEIKAFCSAKYHVSFPMFAKISVRGRDKAPLYQFLTSVKDNPKTGGEIGWNFTKFLVDENGKLIAVFPSKVKPMDDQITKYLN